MPKVEELVVDALKDSKDSMTLVEIAEKIGQSEKKVFKALRKLFESQTIDTQNRRYKLIKR